MSSPASGAIPPVRSALLLDFDGTLADTLPALRQVYADFLDEIDAAGKAPGFAAVNGANLFGLVQNLCRQYAPDRDAAAAWHRYWGSVEQAVLQAMPAAGAHQIVTWARRQGWRVGIGSASRTQVISAWLERHDLAPQIDCIVGADQCDRGKPDPAIYRLLVEKLVVDSAGCIVIEDSDAGVASASAAGLEVIRLTVGPAKDDTLAAHHAASLDAALLYLQTRFEPMRKS